MTFSKTLVWFGVLSLEIDCFEREPLGEMLSVEVTCVGIRELDCSGNKELMCSVAMLHRPRLSWTQNCSPWKIQSSLSMTSSPAATAGSVQLARWVIVVLYQGGTSTDIWLFQVSMRGRRGSQMTRTRGSPTGVMIRCFWNHRHVHSDYCKAFHMG